jgi:hypothetical protein
MKFKVGDKVKHKDFGVGEIVYIDKKATVMPYAVQFETFNEDLHDLGILGAPKIKSGHGWWCEEGELKLVEEGSQNLIPQIAKMLGVEIGEEFKTSNKLYVYKFTKDGLRRIECNGTSNDYFTFFELINGKEKIIKLPKKPLLTEDEKTILRNLPKEYKWIARDCSGVLCVYENKPKKDGDAWTSYSLDYSILFQHLFQFIRWEDEEPYNIEELLEEYEKGKSHE